MTCVPIVFGIEGPFLSQKEFDFFSKHPPFGFILFERNILNPTQVISLLHALRSFVFPNEIYILIDQEGGRVQRLKPFQYWPDFPAVGTLLGGDGMVNDEALKRAYHHGDIIGKELNDLSINVNCAPCCDLRFLGSNNVIGDRSFGYTCDEVALMALSMMEGLFANHITSVIKHIPGHGRSTTDTHHEISHITTSYQELLETDFLVFKKIINEWKKKHESLPWAMTGHLIYDDIDPNHCVTISSKVIKQVIRKEIGFDGLLISDCLTMKALGGPVEERAVKALEAGCDIALHCNGKLDEMKRIVAAVL
jgi:beta-N-acetylhexosaminidase